MPLALILVGLIALCPALCGAADAALGLHGHARAHGPSEPGDCPESSDNCVCHGAVVSPGDAQVPGLDGAGMAWLLLLPPHTPPHPTAHLTWDGSPCGLAALGDSLAVRSYLQNFRC